MVQEAFLGWLDLSPPDLGFRLRQRKAFLSLFREHA